MKNEQIPFEKFARIGITKKDFAQMPDPLREAILSGQLTPMLRLRVPAIHGREMEIPMKIQLVYDKNEQLQLLTYQMHRHLDNRLRLNDAERIEFAAERQSRRSSIGVQTARSATSSWTRRRTA